MKDIDKCYTVLGLSPGASEPEIRLAHKDLLDRLYPDLLSTKSDLRNSAREKITEVNDAYDELLLHISETASKNFLSSPGPLGAEGAEPVLQTVGAASKPEANKEPTAPDSVTPGYIQPAMAVLVLLLYASIFGISGIGATVLAMLSGAAGWMAGRVLVKAVNELNGPRLHKNAVAWMTVALLFVVVISVPMLSHRSPKGIRPAGVGQTEVKSPVMAAPAGSNRQKGQDKSTGQKINLPAGRINPAEAVSLLNKGKELIVAGNYPEAIDALTKSIEMNPGESAAYNSRGVAFAYSHQYGKALDDYNKAIELNPDGDGGYYLNRGIVYTAKGNYQQAVSDYKKAAGLGNEEARRFFDSQNLVW